MKYDAIIFDLGGVIINLDPNLSVQCFQKLIPEFDVTTFNGQEAQLPLYSEFETGKINSQAMVKRFNQHYSSNLSFEQFRQAWNAMILDLPAIRIRLIRKLREQGIKVFLLSNINEIHEQFLEERFAELRDKGHFRDVFDQIYYSHRMGMRKPQHEIFQCLIKEQNLIASKTLFIDDSAHHVRSANSLGIHAIHLTSPTSIIDLEIFKGVV